MVGQPDDRSQTEDFFHRVLHRLAGVFVDDGKHGRQRTALGFAVRPAGQALGFTVEEGRPAAGVGHDYAIADAGQGHGQQLLLAQDFRHRARPFLVGLPPLREMTLHEVEKQSHHSEAYDKGKEPGENGHQVTLPRLSLTGNEQVAFLLFHFADLPADGFHDSLAFTGQDEVPGRLGILFRQVNGPAELLQFGRNLLFQERDAGLLPGVVLRQLLQSLNSILDGGYGDVVRFEVAVFAGNQVASLARFGVLHRGNDAFEGIQYLVGVRDQGIVPAQLKRVPIPQSVAKDKHGD